jgi:hypothetical protein
MVSIRKLGTALYLGTQFQEDGLYAGSMILDEELLG